MPTLSELQATIQQGFRDILFAIKILTGVVGFGILTMMWLMSTYHETEMREFGRLTVTQTVHNERAPGREDVISDIVRRRESLSNKGK